MIHVAVFWTIAVAVVAWALTECCRLAAAQLHLARGVWTVGAAAMVIHAAAAFALLYESSQDVALAAVARQTAGITGINSGAGLYVNYAFVAIWIADAAWWWTVPPARAAVVGVWAWARFTFFLFMLVNGAVVFADGWMRGLGLCAVIAVLATLLWTRVRDRVIAPRMV
jgi:hypothetical protein